MLNRLTQGLAGVWRWLGGLFAFRPPKPEDGGPEQFRKTRSFGRVLWRGGLLVLILLFVVWNVHFLWHVLWIRGHTLTYPQSVLSATPMVPAGVQVTPEGGAKDAKTCGRSQIVAVQAHLIAFLVDQNIWVPSMPQFKAGLLGLASWEGTPYFDNKASFQIGVLRSLRRTAVELADILGRARGTSEVDRDLQAARGLLQYDERTWWFNPFEAERPFGPVQPSPQIYRRAARLYDAFNDRLARCEALFDTRADNLQQFLDRIANDLGSTVDALAKRSQGVRYDAKTDRFVDGEGNDRGWFDTRADNFFQLASGKMYAYHGLLQAARLDFADVAAKRHLDDVWDRMEQHVAEAAVLSPLIVSNGREDGVLMPDHLSIMAENILRARANMTELRDILKR